MKSTVVLMLSAMLLSGCAASIDGDRYNTIDPSFDLQAFFQGNVKAWGIVQNRSGDVVQRFTVDIVGSINNGQLVLDETFSYGIGDGADKRIWTIDETTPGHYRGSAGDILGEAAGGEYGNAFNWTYRMDLPSGKSTYRVTFDDWIWAFDENTIMNRSYIKKFGIVFAEVTIFMQKQ